MNSPLTRRLCFFIVLSLFPCLATAHNYLTDVVVFGSDSSGSWYRQPNVWETRPAESFNLWIQSGTSGGPLLNGPEDALVRPNILMETGEISFRLIAAPGTANAYFGVNLFFNGSEVPSISAYGPMLSSAGGVHSFVADSAASTPKTIPGFNTGYIFPGAGRLSFESGDQTITLSDFSWAAPIVHGLDLVSGYNAVPDGTPDFVGSLSLIVTPIPEPRQVLWILAFLAVLPVLTKKRPISKDSRNSAA